MKILTPPLYKWLEGVNSAGNNKVLVDLDFDLGSDEALELIKLCYFMGGPNSTAFKANFVITMDLEQATAPDADLADADHLFAVHLMKNREMTTTGASLDIGLCRCVEYFPEGTIVGQNLRAIIDWTDASSTDAILYAQLWYRLVGIGPQELRGLIARARARR